MFKRILQVMVLALTLATVVGSASIAPASQDVPDPGCYPCV
jgi:hypothetical protein